MLFRNSLLVSAVLMEAVLDPGASAATGAVGSTPRVRPEAEKVTMEDTRVVEFSGKRKLLKDVLVPSVTEAYEGPLAVRFDFRNGKTRTFAIPDTLLGQFAAHGASQKIGDETAGEDDVDDMVLAVDELIDRLNNGEWAAKREGGGFGGVSILMRALMEHSSKDEVTVKAFLKPKSHAEKMALRAHPPIKVIVERLEAEKAAKAAGSSKVNAGDLLATL